MRLKENTYYESAIYPQLGQLFVRYELITDVFICHRISSFPTWDDREWLVSGCEHRIIVRKNQIGEESSREKAIEYKNVNYLDDNSMLPIEGKSDKDWWTSGTVSSYATNTEIDPRSYDFEDSLNKLLTDNNARNSLLHELKTTSAIGGNAIKEQYLEIYKQLGVF